MIKSILVTNDDGIESKLLSLLLDNLSAVFPEAEIRPVIPMEEKSWIAQAVTRFKPFEVKRWTWETTQGKLLRGFLVDGTPSDCVSLGLFNLYSEQADLVVSGINFGGNAGLPFYLYSGTIGAARAGFIAGTRSIAFSAKLPAKVMNAWNHRELDVLEEREANLNRVCVEAARLTSALSTSKVWDEVDVLNVNIPYELNADPKLVMTHVERLSLGEMYQEVEKNRFQHRLVGIKLDPVDSEMAREQLDSDPSSHVLPGQSDETVLKQGDISLTGIRYDLGVKLSEDIFSQIEQDYRSHRTTTP